MKLKRIISSICLISSCYCIGEDCSEPEPALEINQLTPFQTKPTNGTGLFVVGDALILNAYQEGTEFGISRIHSSSDTPYIGALKRPNFA